MFVQTSPLLKTLPSGFEFVIVWNFFPPPSAVRPRNKQTHSVLEALGVFGAVQGVQGALRWRELHSGTTAPPVYSLATPRPAIKLSIWRARTKDRRFMAAVLKRALRQCYWFYKSVGVIGWRRDWINLPKKEKKPKYLFAFSKWSPIIGVGSGGGHAKHPGVAS